MTNSAQMKNQYVCTMCGFVGKPVKKAKGSLLVEIALWCLFFFPGIIYSLWRISNKVLLCPKCKNSTMIPADSPMASKFLDVQKKNPVA